VLGNYDVRQAGGIFFVGMLFQPGLFIVIIFIAVDEQDYVRILFDAAAVSQVGKLRFVGSAPFRCALSCDTTSTGTPISRASTFSARVI